MEVTKITFDGVELIVPMLDGRPLPMPYPSFKDFDTFCGPGKLGDMIVPDCIFGVHVNAACYIHDVMNAMAQDTEEDHQGNVVFRKNMFAIIEAFEPQPAWEDKYHHARYQRALTYYEWVDTYGLSK